MEDMQNDEQRPPRHKKRKLRWGRLLCLLLIVGLFVAGMFWGSVWIYDTFINPPQRNVVAAADDTIRKDEKLNERINVLLLGIDDGDSEAAEYEPKRTDAIILLSFDPEKSLVSLLSIPRDTKVILPGHKDPDKINAAFAYGGAVVVGETSEPALVDSMTDNIFTGNHVTTEQKGYAYGGALSNSGKIGTGADSGNNSTTTTATTVTGTFT